jgi:hypothetical protein
MENGWVKLYRKRLNNPISQRPAYCHLWDGLLLLAQHKPTTFIWNNHKQALNAGQILTGRRKLSKQFGLPESTIDRILKYFENEHQIEQQKTNKFRIITIKKWQKYQGEKKAGQANGQQMNNKRTANEQQMDTYKNVKNDKNVKKYKGRFKNGRKNRQISKTSKYGETIEA